ETLAVARGHRVVLVAVDDQPGRGPFVRRALEVERLAVRFQVLEQAEAESELLVGADVDDRKLLKRPPEALLLFGVAIEGRDRRPGDEGAHPALELRPGGGEERVAAPAAVAEEGDPLAVGTPGRDPFADRSDHREEVPKLPGVGVGAERGEVRDPVLARLLAAARQVEA